MKNSQKKVLVTGLNGPVGRGAARYFKDKGWFVVGTETREVDFEVDSFHKVPSLNAPAFENALLGIIEEEGPALFIPTASEEVVIAAKFKKELAAHGCAVFVSSLETVKIASDKLKTVRYLSERSIRVPASFGLEPDALKYNLIRDLGLPILMKPIKKRSGSGGVKLCKTVDEFFAEERGGFIFQEFIPGEEFEANLFVDDCGELTATAIFMKDGEKVEGEELRPLLLDVVKALEMRGPVVIRFRIAKKGEPVVIGLNASPGDNQEALSEVLDALVDAWRTERHYPRRGQGAEARASV